MTSNNDYRLNRHHKFKQGGRKYVADLETNEIIQVNDVEWDILDRYGIQTHYQIVEELKEKYKSTAIFDGIARLERLGKQGQLLAQIPNSATKANISEQIDSKLKVLVPFNFTKEKASLDYITNLNRYQLLTAVAQSVELETLGFSQIRHDSIQCQNVEIQNVENFGKLRIRQIELDENNTFTSAWYARKGYDGILLLSQFLTDNLLYYQVPDVPIVHCIDSIQRLQSSELETLLNLHASQKASDTLVVKASWMKEWLTEVDIPEKNVCVIPDGINSVEPIGKALAKQYTATIFEKPMFLQKPVLGLISGFEPSRGAKWISAFAQANPHLAIFVYDSVLAEHYKNPPDNVVIFRADDEKMFSVLPIFLQALDLVCFPAIPGTPISVALEAMAYGTPCIAMTKYDLPPEVSGAGVRVESDWDNSGIFHVPMDQLSGTINQLLVPSNMRAVYEKVANSFTQKYTWQETARKIIQLFEKRHASATGTHQTGLNLFPPIFCRRYNPQTRQITSDAYRLGINRYEHLEAALEETLIEQHKAAEVESVFKHFKAKTPAPTAKQLHRSGTSDIGNIQGLERSQTPEPLTKGSEIKTNRITTNGTAAAVDGLIKS